MSFDSTRQKGNIVKGKLKSQKELKKITSSDEYKKAGYHEKTKMLNVATHKRGALVGGQKKLDKNNNNKIDAQDFKILKQEKAKNRGRGLQDTKMNPGKPMKAALGAIALGLGGKKMMDKKGFKMPLGLGAAAAITKKKKEILGKKKGGLSFSQKMKMVKEGKINKKTGKFTSMQAMREAKGFKPGESATEFNKRRMLLARAKEAAKATTLGKRLLLPVVAGVAATKYLKSKMKKKDKKMGGGMMQKPMGYKTGVIVEKYSPGTEGKIQTAANERLRDIKRNKKTEKNPRASGAAKKAAKKQTAFYQSGATDQMGGPFKKPISKYNVGGSVTVKTKLGRNRPTKMY